jgi:hypothetical protein
MTTTYPPTEYSSSLVTLATFLDDFESGRLPREKWTHQAHLLVAFWYLVNFSREEAVEKVKNGILTYNRTCGVENSATSGYHETLTLFWLRVVDSFLSENADLSSIPDLADALMNSTVANRDLPLIYYSKSHLMSVEARMKWVEPDLKPLI